MTDHIWGQPPQDSVEHLRRALNELEQLRRQLPRLQRRCTELLEQHRRLLDEVDAAIDALAAEYIGQGAWQILLGHRAVQRVRKRLK